MKAENRIGEEENYRKEKFWRSGFYKDDEIRVNSEFCNYVYVALGQTRKPRFFFPLNLI